VRRSGLWELLDALAGVKVSSGCRRLEVLDCTVHDQLGRLLRCEVTHPGNKLYPHVVRVPLVATELVWANNTILRTEEKQRRCSERKVAVPTCNQREQLAQEKSSVVLDACACALWLAEPFCECIELLVRPHVPCAPTSDQQPNKTRSVSQEPAPY
jgi:hypothetical protein